MDAKSKADFINSVASSTVTPCPGCGANNANGSQICSSCGAELNASQNTGTAAPAFREIEEGTMTGNNEKYVEPDAVFAQGLPEWNIEPPQVVVRRR